ncbi:MAG: hypothetical protein M1816_008139 [Peltula sp. TS41687]|nr:MAG: hypothetical protein M1816_008139 [Peltula sp. TS41687]
MPTPTDELVNDVHTPLGTESSLLRRSAITTCPPEDGPRVIAPSAQAPDDDDGDDDPSFSPDDEMMTPPLPTPPADNTETMRLGGEQDDIAPARDEKPRRSESQEQLAPAAIDLPSPAPSAAAVDTKEVEAQVVDLSDEQQQQQQQVPSSQQPASVSAAVNSPIHPNLPHTRVRPRKIHPTMSNFQPRVALTSNPSQLRPSYTYFLHPGSKFRGTQQSERQIYDVQVELKHVDMKQSFLCGYLRIQGLTDHYPTLTTYFEGEIVGDKYTFQTKHPEWGSNDRVDKHHWERFTAYRPFLKQVKKCDYAIKNYSQREHVFMRWKEYFLIPDHKVRTINGASFEGFYYICFNQVSGTVSGIYFHAKSEKHQQLELKHVPDRGCYGAMEFR